MSTTSLPAWRGAYLERVINIHRSLVTQSTRIFSPPPFSLSLSLSLSLSPSLSLSFLSSYIPWYHILSRSYFFFLSFSALSAFYGCIDCCGSRRYRLSIPLPTRYQTRYKVQSNTAVPEPLWAWHAPKADSSVSTAGCPAIYRFATLAKNYTRGSHSLYLWLYFTFFATAVFVRAKLPIQTAQDRRRKCIENRNSHPIVLGICRKCLHIDVTERKIAKNICKSVPIIFLSLIIFLDLLYNRESCTCLSKL